jgi:hypothetical protein
MLTRKSSSKERIVKKVRTTKARRKRLALLPLRNEGENRGQLLEEKSFANA